jgi:hypothetical protein
MQYNKIFFDSRDNPVVQGSKILIEEEVSIAVYKPDDYNFPYLFVRKRGRYHDNILKHYWTEYFSSQSLAIRYAIKWLDSYTFQKLDCAIA